MTRQNTKWLRAMMERYQTDEAGVSEIMRERQQQSTAARKATGEPWKAGYNDKELAKQAGKKGAQARWGTGNTELSKD